MSDKNSIINVDVIIFGGGIAGLWIMNRLINDGYSVILLESNNLGSGQTISSQGIIHGGTKYAIIGKLNRALTSIRDMPLIWRDCLRGKGELDLKSVNILSEYQYLWPASKALSAFTTFLASKVMVNKVDVVRGDDLPVALGHRSFNSTVYRLDEIVLDIPTVLHALAEPMLGRIIKIEYPHYIRFSSDKKNNIESIELTDAGSLERYRLQAGMYVLTAGQFNEGIGAYAQVSLPAMQTRPLHMVMLRGKRLESLYAHCIGKSSTPRLTITTHKDSRDNHIWYIGGSPAESGIHKDKFEQYKFVKDEFKALLPWVETDCMEWASVIIDRAEPKQAKKVRPDTPFARLDGNVITAWPTKLAFAPRLSAQIIQIIRNSSYRSSPHNRRRGDNIYNNYESITGKMEKPGIAVTPWEDSSTKWYEIN